MTTPFSNINPLSMGTKYPAPVPCLPPGLLMARPGLAAPLDIQRTPANIMDLRLRYGLALQQSSLMMPTGNESLMSYFYKDPRSRFFQEEPKPSYSYIGLIAMALLSSKDKKLILGDIYQWILDHYPYFRTRGPGWRNSIRHNLSLNDCFIKAGRAANGKGHYWAIHPANLDDFTKGDFRRRRAQRKVRQAMGLEVPDEEDSPSPPPGSVGPMDWHARMIQDPAHRPIYPSLPPATSQIVEDVSPQRNTKRGFDVASLLAPDTSRNMDDSGVHTSSEDGTKEDLEDDEDEWIDVDSTGPSIINDNVKSGAKRKLELDDDVDISQESLRPTKIHKTNPDNQLVDNTQTLALHQSKNNIIPNPANIWLSSQQRAIFPSPYIPWPALNPASFTAAMYASAIARSTAQTHKEENIHEEKITDEETNDINSNSIAIKKEELIDGK